MVLLTCPMKFISNLKYQYPLSYIFRKQRTLNDSLTYQPTQYNKLKIQTNHYP